MSTGIKHGESYARVSFLDLELLIFINKLGKGMLNQSADGTQFG